MARRVTLLFLFFFPALLYAQTGSIIESGDEVLDPNQDGFVSIVNSGFSGDNYDVDEFEIPMFGIPIIGDGEVVGDTQTKPCGVVDMVLDTAGYATYAAFDSNENLIFRFRLAKDQQSVESYSILLDTDQLVGSLDPNATSENPGFEIAITLINRKGVYIYDIDGAESCPNPIYSYNVDTHQQKSIAGTTNCGTEDIYLDFYVPFDDLTSGFGITPSSNLRFVGVTNISATCALDGNISDIGGVDDTEYNGCFSCAVLDLTENQCPTSINNLCNDCVGFPEGFTAKPIINVPILANEVIISGIATPQAEIYLELYASNGDLLQRDTTLTASDSSWISNEFDNPLTLGDSVVVSAYIPGKCVSGFDNANQSFAIVDPNAKPVVTGSEISLSYKATDPPLVIGEDLSVIDDNINLLGATVSIASNFQIGVDELSATPSPNISVTFSSLDGVLNLSGVASISEYEDVLRTVAFYNTSSEPDIAIREISIIVDDGTFTSTPFLKSILIIPLNEIPIISGSASLLTYTEGDGAVPIDDLLNISDNDDTDLVTAVVRFSLGYIAEEDTLLFTDQNGISSVFAEETLTLIGTASLINYQSALRSVAYSNKSSNPTPTDRQIEIIINDGTDNSLSYYRTIEIIPVNDPPSFTGTEDPLNYSEGDGAMFIDNGAAITDVDNLNMQSATVTITANFTNTEDLLEFTNQNGISGSYAAGSMMLTGSASLANYQTAIQSITYSNSSENPNTATRTISFVINDGTDNSVLSTRDILISPVNDMPTISGSAADLTYNEGDGQMIIDNNILISDIDNTTLSSATVTIAANFGAGEDQLHFTDQLGISGSYSNGVLTLTGTTSLEDYMTALKTVAYENTSSAPITATRTIEFIVNDGTDNSNNFARNILIIPFVEATVLTNGSGGTDLGLDYTEGDGAVAIHSDLDITDPDDINLESVTVSFTSNYVEGEDVLAFANQAGISGVFDALTGVLTLSGTASLNDYLTALLSITYENTSESPSALTRTLDEVAFDGDVMSNAITLTINVTPVNDAPELDGQSDDLTYQESSGAIAIENSISVTDVDSDDIHSAVVRFSSGFNSMEDLLDYSSTSGISGTYDPGTGILSFSGQASLAEYETLLRSVTYTNSNERADLSTRTVEFIVNDSELDSEPFARRIMMEEVIDPVIVYQVVSPNGDAMNDTWVIDGIEQYPENTVKVFNRWNNLVYKKTSYENTIEPWRGDANEGMTNGELVDGTYFYTVDLGNGSKIIEGFLVLKRK